MCSVLKERLPHQIRALAVNLEEHTLAVGYGMTIALMNRTKVEGNGTWDLTQRIPGSVDDKSGLVASLLYFPGPSNRLSLLVLYTESGFGVWKASGDFSIIPASSGTCRVGSGSITSDGGTLAISTLDQTLVTYSLDENGPILAEKREYINPEPVSQYPVVPAGITEDGLAFGGTTKGQVLVISMHKKNDHTLIQHEDENHIIRMISDHYRIDQSIYQYLGNQMLFFACKRNRSSDTRTNGFRITVTEAMLGWREVDRAWPTNGEHKATGTTKPSAWKQAGNKVKTKEGTPKPRIRVTRGVLVAFAFVFLAMVLAAMPPNAEPFNQRSTDPEETAVLKPTMEQHTYWILYGLQYSARYLKYQVTHWAAGLSNTA
ncbi:hypothetical protein FRC11_013124, partial [Ceratobasidium sp. 423]